jgi:hypothetical protein
MRAFDDIARAVSEMASTVKCSPEEYREGLREIISTLETDIRASEETSA